jgi:hypothetical protein
MIRPHPVKAEQRKGKPKLQYKWIEGASIEEYNISALKWKEYTSTDEFAASFNKIMEEYKDHNDKRAKNIEEFMLEEAQKAGVVKTTNKRQFKNPNKWEKQLAPWFS